MGFIFAERESKLLGLFSLFENVEIITDLNSNPLTLSTQKNLCEKKS